MESIYTNLACYGSKNECARTDSVFLPIYDVCNGTISHDILSLFLNCKHTKVLEFIWYLNHKDIKEVKILA